MASPIPLLDPVIRYDCMFGISGVVQEAMRVIVIPFCFQVVRRMPAEQYAELILVRKPSRFDCTLGFQILTVIEEYYEMLNPCECPTHAGPIAVFCASRIHTTIVGGKRNTCQRVKRAGYHAPFFRVLFFEVHSFDLSTDACAWNFALTCHLHWKA